MSVESPVDGEEAVSRAAMYRFLSGVYLNPPGKDLLRLLADPDFLGDLRDLFGAPAASSLAAGVGTGEPEQALASVTQDYMDLFAVPTGRYVMPFEDVYLGGSAGGQLGPLLGARAIAARRLYHEAGMQVDTACRELPTHAGVELGFMGLLCESEAAAEADGRASEARRYRDLERRFLQQHLSAWLPSLCDAVRSHAATSFYRGVASLTEVFLARETVSFDADGREDDLECVPASPAVGRPLD